MKLHLTLPLIICFLLTSVLTSLSAQSSPEAIDDLIRQTNREIQRLEGKGRKIGRIEFGRISVDSTAISFRQMHRGEGNFGNEYEIIAFASELEMGDMDILLFEIIDNEPQLIMKNISKTPKAKLTFQPAEDKIYIVTLKGYNFETADQDAQFSMIISFNSF